MAAPVLRNASDSYVAEKYPAKNHSSMQRLYLGSDGGERYAFLYFGIPSGMFGTTVLSAKVRVRSGGGFSGSVTLTLQRVAAKYANGRITWNNMPGVTGSSVQVTKSGAAAGTEWEFDVTTQMQTVANGTAWYGFRIHATGTAVKWLYSANGRDDYRPTLEIQWSNAPHAPSVLIPDNGQAISVAKPTLQWDFTDPNGDTSMEQFNLRLFSSLANANANTSAILDTTVASDVPQVDLDDTAYGGLALAGTLWWRVRVQDGAGLWSAWSDVAYFTRVAKGTLTITNPSAVTPIVEDSTPPFMWTFTGQTQRAYEVIITLPAEEGEILWRSGVVTSTDQAVTPPSGIIDTPGTVYRLFVRVYDTINRRWIPDDPSYTQVYRDFTYQFDPTTDPVTSFTASPDGIRPKTVLQWQRSAAPDYFVILRDGKVIDTVEPTDVFVSGTTYSYTDRTATPRKTHTWSVAAKINGRTSATNPTDTGIPKLVTTVLMDLDQSDEVFLFNPDVQAARAESSDVHYPLGSAEPVLITQSLRGYEGTVTGVIADGIVPGLTQEAQLASLTFFRRNPGRKLVLSWKEKNIKVVVYNITESSVSYPDGRVDHVVSFSFFQVDF